MKITSFSILFIIIVFPLFLSHSTSVKLDKNARRLELKYESMIKNAVADAAVYLSTESEGGFNYRSDNNFILSKEEALNVFYNTICCNINLSTARFARESFKGFIPAIIFLDYDGYYIYTVQEYSDKNGEQIIEHIWLPKRYYTYTDVNGNLLCFTLGDDISVYDKSNNKLITGLREEISAASPVLSNPDFDQYRRNAVVKRIEADLKYYVNQHNKYAKQYGIVYRFTFPEISRDDWGRAIEDIGLIAFVQGIPVGNGKYFNTYAVGGSRIIKSPQYYGFIDKHSGLKYYCREGCNHTQGDDFEFVKLFSSKKEAALEGYFPCIHCAP